MKILSIRPVHGPNVFHHRPVLIAKIDLEELTDVASNEIPGFVDRLLKLIPSLYEHHCSPGHKGGFVERLNRGTYFAHIIEHIALELSEMAGIGVDYGKSVHAGEDGIYQIAVRFKSEEGMTYLLEKACDIANSVVKDTGINPEEIINEAKEIIRENSFGPSTDAIVQAAIKRKIPWQKLPGLGLVQLGWGKHRKFVQATTTSFTSDLGVQIARDKEFTKKLLDAASIPVPQGRLVHTLEEAISALEDFDSAVAVKPFDGNHGRGITLNVRTKEEVIPAFHIAKDESTAVIIEECFKGKDFRVVMVDGKMIAAAERVPAHVIGDGVSTIQELVDRENENELRGTGHEKPLTKIVFDESSLNFLVRKNISLDQIPANHEIVYLRETANLSTGGEAKDVTDIVHPEIKFICERAAKIVGLDVCGLDLILQDITKPLSLQRGGVIEVNAGPGIRMHHYPSVGKSRDVGGAILDFMFKEKLDGRIPVISVTGTNGKTTVVRILDHILADNGKCVGTTTTDGIFINGKEVMKGDTTGPISARSVLSDPTVEVAVLETARGGIVRRGLAFDWCDVGVITNINADHLGQDGIESIDDILKIKSLVVERVKKNGTIILNADSKELVELTQKLDLESRHLVYFSMTHDSPVIHEHIQNGGTAYFLRDNQIILAHGPQEESLIHVSEIPLTLGGTASFHVANCMSVIASLEAIGQPLNDVLRSLCSFSNNEKNKGRTNLYRVGKGHVLVDYGHNPDALISIGDMTKKWNVTKRTAVIAVPGDRSDEMISMSGIAAALMYDKVIVREDEDLRGRAEGEVADILCKSVAKEKNSVPCLKILSPLESLKTAIDEMSDGELVVYFYESFEEVEKILEQVNAQKSSIETLLPKSIMSRMDMYVDRSHFEKW